MKKSNAFSYVRTIITFPFSICHYFKEKAYLTAFSADPLLTYISETCGKLICWILIYKTRGDNVSAVNTGDGGGGSNGDGGGINGGGGGGNAGCVGGIAGVAKLQYCSISSLELSQEVLKIEHIDFHCIFFLR